jgi:hypothetical protein
MYTLAEPQLESCAWKRLPPCIAILVYMYAFVCCRKGDKIFVWRQTDCTRQRNAHTHTQNKSIRAYQSRLSYGWASLPWSHCTFQVLALSSHPCTQFLGLFFVPQAFNSLEVFLQSQCELMRIARRLLFGASGAAAVLYQR